MKKQWGQRGDEKIFWIGLENGAETIPWNEGRSLLLQRWYASCPTFLPLSTPHAGGRSPSFMLFSLNGRIQVTRILHYPGP